MKVLKWNSPSEDWCLDEWFAEQENSVWALREAKDSEPGRESFLLLPSTEKSERPLYLIACFIDTEPKQLLKELAAVYNVSADQALNSPETMAKLTDLYEKLHNFNLDE